MVNLNEVLIKASYTFVSAVSVNSDATLRHNGIIHTQVIQYNTIAFYNYLLLTLRGQLIAVVSNIYIFYFGKFSP